MPYLFGILKISLFNFHLRDKNLFKCLSSRALCTHVKSDQIPHSLGKVGAQSNGQGVMVGGVGLGRGGGGGIFKVEIEQNQSN